MVSNKTSKTDFSTHQSSLRISLILTKRVIAVTLRNKMMMEMNITTIFRQHLKKRARKAKKNIMKKKKLRKKIEKRSHLSNYITSTKKTMIS